MNILSRKNINKKDYIPPLMHMTYVQMEQGVASSSVFTSPEGINRRFGSIDKYFEKTEMMNKNNINARKC